MKWKGVRLEGRGKLARRESILEVLDREPSAVTMAAASRRNYPDLMSDHLFSNFEASHETLMYENKKI